QPQHGWGHRYAKEPDDGEAVGASRSGDTVADHPAGHPAMTPRQTPRLNARSHWYRRLLRPRRERPRHGRAAEQVMNSRALDVPEVPQARPQPLPCGTLEGKAENPDARRFRPLLRARRERPRRRAADERDELASPHSIELHSVPASQGRIA